MGLNTWVDGGMFIGIEISGKGAELRGKIRVIYMICCYGVNVCTLSNSYVEALTPNMMVFGDGAFGRWLSLSEVMRVRPKKRKMTRALSLCHVRTQQEIS